MRACFYVVVLLSAGCLRATEYHCTSSDQCGTGGTCEASGYCSFADSSCGQRYGAQAGPYANQCVGTTGGRPPPSTNVFPPLTEYANPDSPCVLS